MRVPCAETHTAAHAPTHASTHARTHASRGGAVTRTHARSLARSLARSHARTIAQIVGGVCKAADADPVGSDDDGVGVSAEELAREEALRANRQKTPIHGSDYYPLDITVVKTRWMYAHARPHHAHGSLAVPTDARTRSPGLQIAYAHLRLH